MFAPSRKLQPPGIPPWLRIALLLALAAWGLYAAFGERGGKAAEVQPGVSVQGGGAR
ncbi:MAG: hypothetical protein ACREVL_12635 [Solimonas sp.]